jgi:hypothetical protein
MPGGRLFWVEVSAAVDERGFGRVFSPSLSRYSRRAARGRCGFATPCTQRIKAEFSRTSGGIRGLSLAIRS